MDGTFSAADHARLRATFDKFDKDGSQTIDLGELADVMSHLGVKMTDTQLANLVEQANVNEKGELEFEAFAQLISIWREAAKMKIFDGPFDSTGKEKIANALRTRLFVTDSWGRCVFDACIALVAVAHYVIILLDDVARFPLYSAVLAVEVIACIAFGADLIVSAFTFRGTDTILADVKMYAKSWLVPDVIALVPWGLIIPGAAGTLCRHFRFIKLIKLLEFWKDSGRVLMSPGYITFHFKILPITLLAVSFCLMVHGFTVGFIYVKQSNGTDAVLDADGSYSYSIAVSLVIYTLTTIGYGTVDINTPNERLYCCVVLCGAILSNGFIVGKLVAIMQRADVQQDKRGKLRQTLAVLEHFDLPLPLQDEVLQFQDHLLGHAIGASYASTLAGMPSEMHSNINIVVKVRLLGCAPFFVDLHAVVKVALAQRLVNVVLVPEQFVLGTGEQVRTMYFIAYGFVDVVGQSGSRLRTLASNQFFGGGMLIDNVISTVAVKAMGYCDLWSLNRAELLTLTRRFPPLRKVMVEAAAKIDEFECAKSVSRTQDDIGVGRKPIVSIADESQTSELLDDGELENAADFNALKAKTERLQSIWSRTQDCQRRLLSLCENPPMLRTPAAEANRVS